MDPYICLSRGNLMTTDDHKNQWKRSESSIRCQIKQRDQLYSSSYVFCVYDCICAVAVKQQFSPKLIKEEPLYGNSSVIRYVLPR